MRRNLVGVRLGPTDPHGHPKIGRVPAGQTGLFPRWKDAGRGRLSEPDQVPGCRRRAIAADPPGPRLVEKLRYHAGLSIDGKQLALGAMHTVTVWDLASGKPRHTLETPMYEVDYGAFSPDGRLLAVANRFIGSVDAWDLATEKRLSEGYVEHSSRDGSVAWLAENKLVATTDINGMIRLWEARTGRQKTLIRCDNHNVAELAISPTEICWHGLTGPAARFGSGMPVRASKCMS